MPKIPAVNVQIAPSILAADFASLGDEVEAVVAAGADLIHFDVMDNHFVPNLSVGPPVLKSLKHRFPDVLFDVHVMANPVDPLVDEFIELGPAMISVHPETCADLGGTLNRIRQRDIKAGAVLNPDSSESELDAHWNDLDFVLIMSVKPGFGGQSFMPEVLPKLTRVRDIVNDRGLKIAIEIDGGIGSATIGDAAQAGANIFVAGSAIFSSSDYASTIMELRRIAS